MVRVFALPLLAVGSEKRSTVQQDSSSAVDQQHYSKTRIPSTAGPGFGYFRSFACIPVRPLPTSSSLEPRPLFFP
jgi:hypothetical protein